MANATPLLIRGEKTPIDLGKKFLDGRRILGDGKTYEGLTAGFLAGFLTGVLQIELARGAVLAVGAMMGDLGGSFLKRRVNIGVGRPAPLLDQLDFIAGALGLAFVFSFSAVLSIWHVTLLLLITPPIHLATNAAAYCLKLKGKPY